MSVNKFNKFGKDGIILGLLGLCAIGAIAFFILSTNNGRSIIDVISGNASITLKGPESLNVNNRDEFIVDVVVEHLPNQDYPAASLSISFDNNYLEFTGIRQGNMRTVGNRPGTYSIPFWESDLVVANERGLINTMYLDMSGGDHPYIIDDNTILLRLAFRLKDSVSVGNSLDIHIEDAVFATNQAENSVSIQEGNLRGNDASIIIE